MKTKVKIGDSIKANVAYKYVPSIQCKVQTVKVIGINGGIYTGATVKGKTVHFTDNDIQH